MRTAVVLCLAALLACNRPKADATGSPPTGAAIPPKPPEYKNPTPEALERKGRSETRLKSEGVLVPASLPVIAAEADAKIRAQDAVVDRAVALVIVAVKGEGLEQPDVLAARDRFGASNFFTPKEKVFVLDLHPDDTTKTQFAWKYECLAVMQWALGFEPTLGSPDKIVDAAKIVGLMMKDKGPQKFRSEARLRSAKELLDEADLIYRYDWACVNARVSRKPPPTGVNCEIVVERHHALNWLIGYQGQEWDDVSTDT